MAGKKGLSKKLPKAPLSMSKPAPKKVSKKELRAARRPTNLIKSRPKNFGVGRDIMHKRDLSRFVKWPRCVRVQRQEKVLLKRLRVPPAVNQFSYTLDKGTSVNLFKLMHKYRPETRQAKKERLLKEAEDYKNATNKEAFLAERKSKKPFVLKFGLNHVTKLIEKKRALLVVIAHDVQPLELVIWLPALCRKLGVPYCIVKGKSRLGKLVHLKNATAVCLTRVKPEDSGKFRKICDAVKLNFNAKADELCKTWGAGVMSRKSQDRQRKLRKARNLELTGGR